MLGRLLAVFSIIVCATVAQPAHACMLISTYPAFWNHAPLFPEADDLVVRVALQANTIPENDAGYWTSCDGGAYVFDVLEVLHGEFDGGEIAVVLPSSGGFYNEPDYGETRILVGKLRPAIRFGERTLITNVHELKAALEADRYDVPVESKTIGAPSTLPVLEFREPPEGRFVMQAMTVLSVGLGWLIVGLPILIGLVFIIGATWLFWPRRMTGRY